MSRSGGSLSRAMPMRGEAWRYGAAVHVSRPVEKGWLGNEVADLYVELVGKRFDDREPSSMMCPFSTLFSQSVVRPIRPASTSCEMPRRRRYQAIRSPMLRVSVSPQRPGSPASIPASYPEESSGSPERSALSVVACRQCP